jgi:hypothetical protein
MNAISSPRSGMRPEFRALVEASDAHPSARKLWLSATHAGLPKSTPEGIEVLPAYLWLLEDEQPRSGSDR